MKKQTRKTLFKLSILASAVLAAQAMAGGFQLYEQDAEGLGTYHAGMAANTDTAAIEFYNPAGMTDFKRPAISAGGTMVALTTSFKGLIDIYPAEGPGSTTNYIPNFHAVMPFSYRNHAAAVGFGVNVPFGLSSNYPRSSKGNDIGLGGTNTTLETVNIGPSIAFQITPKISFGAGADFMYGQADYNGEVDIFDLSLDHYTNHLQGTGWGYNLGLMLEPSASTHIGFAYRSDITLNAHGTSIRYNDQNQKTLETSPTAKISIPASFAVSFDQDMNSRWQVMGTAMYTKWSVFNSLTINNVAVIPFVKTGENISVNYDYKDSWMASIGTKYWFTQRDAISLGYGRDQTPTRNGHRDIRLPDGDRWIVSAGLEHKFNCNSNISLGYAYVDMGKTKINNIDTGSLPLEYGTSTGHANLIGVQLNYKFA